MINIHISRRWFLFHRHLKLELLTQFPASNDGKIETNKSVGGNSVKDMDSLDLLI